MQCAPFSVCFRQLKVHELSTPEPTIRGRAAILHPTEDLREVLLYPGQVHLVHDADPRFVALIDGAVDDIEDTARPEVTLKIHVAQHIGAVGPIRSHWNEDRF